LARRATYIKANTSKRDHVLAVDCGDFVPGNGAHNELKARYLLQGFAELKYDAINLGEKDFLLGTQFLLDTRKKFDLPLISANVFYPDSTTPFIEPYIIKKLKDFEYGDVKMKSLTVGIFGVLMTRPSLVTSPQEPKLITKDPIKVAAKIVAKLKNKCDVIIALAHLSTQQINRLADEVPGIDIIVGGHDYMRRCNLSDTNDVILLQTGTKGQYIGDLIINFDDDRKITSHDGKTVLLDKQYKDDPDMLKIVDEYEKDAKKIAAKQAVHD